MFFKLTVEFLLSYFKMFVLHKVGMMFQEQGEPTLKFLTLTGNYPISETERPFAFFKGVHGK